MPRHYLVVEDHPIVQSALCATLRELEPDCTIRSAARLADALRLLREASPVDLVLFDLSLPDSSGVEGLMALRQRHPDCPVAVVSANADSPMIVRCLDLGAAGYITKVMSNDAILGALRMIAAGCGFVPPQVLATEQPARLRHEGLPGRTTDPRSLGLTDRQSDVLRLLLRGLPNKLICRHLALAEGTVKVHVSAVLRALGARNRTQAVIAASRIGLRVSD